jgi:serine/threonine protein kinase
LYVDIILDKIGEGGFGNVYLCLKKCYDGLCAVKCIKSSKSIDTAKKERQFGYISKLNSYYLVKYFETFTINNDLYVVMQYFENGSLYELIKRYQKENKKIPKNVYFTLFRMYIYLLRILKIFLYHYC